eukprot:s286_g3.t1
MRCKSSVHRRRPRYLDARNCGSGCKSHPGDLRLAHRPDLWSWLYWRMRPFDRLAPLSIGGAWQFTGFPGPHVSAARVCKGPGEPPLHAPAEVRDARRAEALERPVLEPRPPYHGRPPVFEVPSPSVAALAPAPFIRGTFVVLCPDMQGEVISLALRAPCELDFAIQEVNEARPEERRLCFPDLHPAEPQPDEGYGVLLGRPAWADQVPVACIDARGLGDRLFAKPVSSRLTRESILLHVGMSADSGVDVHVGHAWAPLRRGEMAALAHGTLITLAPARVLFRPGPSLQVMLLGTQGWQEEPAIPAGPTEKHVYVLTDGLPITFSVATPRTGSFRAAVAQALQYDLEKTSAQSSLPPITDFLSNGQACKGVVAFTEKICQIPVPPGLLRPPQYVVFLDLRAIFLGFEWALASNGLLAVDPLLARFSDRAPPFFKAVILGGTPRSEHGQTFHQVWSGQVLQVQFVEDLPSHSSVDSADLWGSDSGSSDSSDSDGGDGDSSAGGASSVHSDRRARHDGGSDEQAPDRSRSPRSPAARCCAASAQRALLAGCCFLTFGLVLLVAWFLMWRVCMQHDVFPVDSSPGTPVSQFFACRQASDLSARCTMASYVFSDGLLPLGATLCAPRKNRGPFCWVYLIGAFAVLAQPCGAVQLCVVAKRAVDGGALEISGHSSFLPREARPAPTPCRACRLPLLGAHLPVDDDEDSDESHEEDGALERDLFGQGTSLAADPFPWDSPDWSTLPRAGCQ